MAEESVDWIHYDQYNHVPAGQTMMSGDKQEGNNYLSIYFWCLGPIWYFTLRSIPVQNNVKTSLFLCKNNGSYACL